MKKYHFIKNGVDTLYRYPIILLSAFVSALFLILSLEYEQEVIFSLAKISTTASLGISLFFALQMTFQRRKDTRKFLYYLIGAGILVLYHFIILPKDFGTPTIKEIISSISFFLLSHLLATFLPFISQKNSEENFWEYNKNLFINSFLAYVFIVVFILGINLALAAISILFNIDIEYKIYTYFSLFSAILGSCFIFLSFIPKGLESLETESDYPKVLKFFTQFILIPLLIIYGIILYFYGAKILFTWELPKGWVSIMVMTYSTIGIFAFLLVYPLKKEGIKSWVQFFSKIFHYSILPLLILLFVAIFTRTLEYGFTENRYFVLLYAIWITIISLYFIFCKKVNIRFIPISLFTFIVLGIFFPFINAFYVSKISQKNTLEKILAETQVLKNGKIDFSKEISYENAENISEHIAFLANRDEKDYIMSFIDQNKKNDFTQIFEKNKARSYQIIKMFNTKDNYSYPKMETITNTNSIIPLQHQYDYLIINNNDDVYSIDSNTSINISSTGFILKSKDKTYKYIFDDHLKEYILQNENKEHPKPITFNLGDYEILFYGSFEYLKENDILKNIKLYTYQNYFILLRKIK